MSGQVTNIIGSILDPLDTSKSFSVSLSGASSGVSNTFSFSSTTDRMYSWPDSDIMLVGTNTVQTLTGKTIDGGSNTFTNIVASSSITSGSVTNSLLANSSVTVTAGTGLSGGGSVALGSNVTLSLAEPASSVTSASNAISTVETYISSSFPIGAATIGAGDSFRITIYGTCTSTSGSGAPTFNIRFGTTGTTSDTSLLSSTYTSAASGTSVVFKWEGVITFRSTTSAIASSILTNTDSTGISTTSTVPNIGSVVSGLTSSAAFLGVSFVTSSVSTSVTFQQVIVNRIR